MKPNPCSNKVRLTIRSFNHWLHEGGRRQLLLSKILWKILNLQISRLSKGMTHTVWISYKLWVIVIVYDSFRTIQKQSSFVGNNNGINSLPILDQSSLAGTLRKDSYHCDSVTDRSESLASYYEEEAVSSFDPVDFSLSRQSSQASYIGITDAEDEGTYCYCDLYCSPKFRFRSTGNGVDSTKNISHVPQRILPSNVETKNWNIESRDDWTWPSYE